MSYGLFFVVRFEFSTPPHKKQNILYEKKTHFLWCVANINGNGSLTIKNGSTFHENMVQRVRFFCSKSRLRVYFSSYWDFRCQFEGNPARTFIVKEMPGFMTTFCIYFLKRFLSSYHFYINFHLTFLLRTGEHYSSPPNTFLKVPYFQSKIVY